MMHTGVATSDPAKDDFQAHEKWKASLWHRTRKNGKYPKDKDRQATYTSCTLVRLPYILNRCCRPLDLRCSVVEWKIVMLLLVMCTIISLTVVLTLLSISFIIPYVGRRTARAGRHIQEFRSLKTRTCDVAWPRQQTELWSRRNLGNTFYVGVR